jgi:DNA repair protein RadC
MSYIERSRSKNLETLYKEDKPREKLLYKGVEALKAYELLAILLGSGTRGKDVLKLSKEIVKLLEEGVEELSLEKLTHIHGLGNVKAMQILAAIELSRRYLVKQSVKISSAKDAYMQLLEYIPKKQEHFVLITLDGAHSIIEKRVVFVGTLNSSLVHPREVFAHAITDRAASIIVAHNHPSGQCFPSVADKQVTHRLKEASEMIGIELLDHIIVTSDGYYSFDEKGIL